MFMFNRSGSHAVISFVGSGHVLFMNTATKAPIQCIDVGVQAHAAMPSNDQTFVVVANQNGRLLQRINTNYQTNTFTLDNAATINLATCTTPNGAPCQDATLRPDTRPICPVSDTCDRFAFITLAGGGLFVVDPNTTPMWISVSSVRSAMIQPDLLDISPDGKYIFMSLRGPNPLTGNNPLFNNSVGSTPGVGVIRVQQASTRGRFIARLPITHIVGGVERADPYGLRVRVK